MFKKKGKKQYSVAEKYAYHEKREESAPLGSVDHEYSRAWLSGYNDSYPERNFRPLKNYVSEIRKAHGVGWDELARASSYGRFNGMKAQLLEDGKLSHQKSKFGKRK